MSVKRITAKRKKRERMKKGINIDPKRRLDKLEQKNKDKKKI